jgi:hypothetical protein
MQTELNGVRSAKCGSNTTRAHFARAVEPSLEQNRKIGHLDYTEKNINNNIMACKDICHKYPGNKRIGSDYYEQGGKRCHTCDTYVNMPGPFCLCCGWRLRTRPRNKSYLQKMREKTRLRREEKQRVAMSKMSSALLAE